MKALHLRGFFHKQQQAPKGSLLLRQQIIMNNLSWFLLI